MSRPKVALVIDGPDPDNYVALLASISAVMEFDLVAVIMTGRPVCSISALPPFVMNPYASRAVRRDNALHAKGILMRHGGEHVPVFTGGIAPFSTVPHHLHIHERVTDIYDDAHAGHVLAGDIYDAVSYLASLNEVIHFMGAGPMTDLDFLRRQPMLEGRLGILVAQLGMFGFNPKVKTIAGGRKQFNTLTDVEAARGVVLHWPSPMYLIPTDVTKDPAFAFHSADEFAEIGESSASQEIVAMYGAAWPHMWGPMGIPAHVHDFHVPELMNDLIQLGLHYSGPLKVEREYAGRYELKLTGIDHVPYLPHEKDRWGEIDLRSVVADDPTARRFVATRCTVVATDVHRMIMRDVLNNVNLHGSRTSINF